MNDHKIIRSSLSMHVPLSEKDRRTKCEWLCGCPHNKNIRKISCKQCPAMGPSQGKGSRVPHSEAATFWMTVLREQKDSNERES